MEKMTEERYEKIKEAQNTLCSFCENDACENCIVTLLGDQAHDEAVAEGIIDED